MTAPFTFIVVAYHGSSLGELPFLPVSVSLLCLLSLSHCSVSVYYHAIFVSTRSPRPLPGTALPVHSPTSTGCLAQAGLPIVPCIGSTPCVKRASSFSHRQAKQKSDSASPSPVRSWRNSKRW